MPGVSAEQHLFSGSFFSEHSSSPCSLTREEMQNPLSPQRPLALSSPDESELRARSLKIGIEQMDALNFFSDAINSEKCSPRHGNDPPVRKTLAQSISFGSSGYGFSFVDDFPSMESHAGGDGLMFSEGFQNGFSSAIQKDDSGSIPMPAAFSTNAVVVESPDAITALHKFLPSNNEDETSWAAVDAYSCDEFRMYEFKVRRCMRGRSHDWTECPFAHPGEKARRRDPRRFHYSGTGCPDFRKGSCRRGDACEFAHGVFECWLHPARYRTQPCKDGRNCRRRVCFFAHTPEQLRLLPGSSQAVNVGSRNSLQVSSLRNSMTGSYDGSPLRYAVSGSPSFDGAFAYDGSNPIYYEGGTNAHAGSPRAHWGYLCKANPSQNSSPTSTLVGHSHSPPPLSPPLSPSGSPPMSPDSPTSWPGSVNYSMSPRYQKTSTAGNVNNLQVQLSSGSFSSLSAGYQNSVSATASLGITSPATAHRRQAEMMGSFPSIAVPSASSPQLSCVLTQADGQSSPKVIGDLISSLQSMEMGSAPLWLQQQPNRLSQMAAGLNSPRAASNLRHCSLSLPSTPTKSRWEAQVDNWEGDVGADGLQRVESGRDLRAKIYAKLSKESNLQDIGSNNSNGDSPDLGWVNELVM